VADLELFRDVLDKPLVDKSGTKMGRVDGLILRLHADAPPEIAWLETGPEPLLSRISVRLAQKVVGLARRWGVDSGEPVRIEPSQVIEFGKQLTVDIAAARSNALAWERWLRKKLIDRIPGSGG
jgi:hypothetical protein